ncbi:hypothetical protein BASA50_004294 [Batrachochytrium salamandrivorans]|uniref:Uncharacterized protein n=1 Tax=Batrachochytrium salamandrivorans TaxID=1357716 RepID=A0ABQ8FFY9_9FUNG|nr:hypothetical protein BASA62_002638 [Batrachochytrium salamandrivorans]KAH6580482.1 hypothetical protein BASA61_009630 [Batrachochytrium salamandrivorans]KAH6581403.1 hypothetical protein BASA60_002460 [Batrachochytrium salamandrivorans]KAH6597689.1 hypothetical protein BASA50_004294 [Batrachochytrium salamandrivorans]KAH9249089.1 hypothetical protein BASA81_013208 [Batrachochytrium salamandrivorans]
MPQSHTPTQPAFSYKPQQRKSNPKPQVYSHIVPTGTRIKGVGFVPTPTTPGSQGTPSPAKFPIEAPKGAPQFSDIVKLYSGLPRSTRIGLSFGLLGISLVGIWVTDLSESSLLNTSLPQPADSSTPQSQNAASVAIAAPHSTIQVMPKLNPEAIKVIEAELDLALPSTKSHR